MDVRFWHTCQTLHDSAGLNSHGGYWLQKEDLLGPLVRKTSTKYEVVSEGTSYCVQPRPTGKRTSKLYETTGREVSQRLATRPHPHHCSHDTT